MNQLKYIIMCMHIVFYSLFSVPIVRFGSRWQNGHVCRLEQNRSICENSVLPLPNQIAIQGGISEEAVGWLVSKLAIWADKMNR